MSDIMKPSSDPADPTLRDALRLAGATVLMLMTLSCLSAGQTATAAETPGRDASGGLAAKTVVLVHGAFADGSSWAKVIPLLSARDLAVVAVQNPLSSLADDVAATARAIDQAEGPVVLVGHSWGGVVVTEAGINPKVSSIVYVAAFAPDVGQSVVSLTRPFGPRAYSKEIRKDQGGFLTLTTKGIQDYFAPDLPAPEQLVVAATQGPYHESAPPTPVTKAAWKVKPTWTVISGADRVIPPELQEMMAKANSSTVTRVPDASHVVMLGHPQVVAETILAAAKAR
jgi:pimeloyl-ACP methyl ester carboxylesterase